MNNIHNKLNNTFWTSFGQTFAVENDPSELVISKLQNKHDFSSIRSVYITEILSDFTGIILCLVMELTPGTKILKSIVEHRNCFCEKRMFPTE